VLPPGVDLPGAREAGGLVWILPGAVPADRRRL